VIHSPELGRDEWARKNPRKVDPLTSGAAPIWVRPAVACQMASIGLTKLYELIADGQVVSRKLGGARLVSVASLESLGED
jgi:hypothetical protein